MADDFEIRFYALLEEFGGQGYVDAFKAKGDEARILGDLSEDFNDRDFIDAVLGLVTEYGVTDDPPQYRVPKKAIGPSPYYHLRDLTFGELKETVSSGHWPKDAWVLTPVSILDWLGYIAPLLFAVGCVSLLTSAVLAPWFEKHLFDPSYKMFVRQLGLIAFIAFMASTPMSIALFLVAFAWSQLKPAETEWIA